MRVSALRDDDGVIAPERQEGVVIKIRYVPYINLLSLSSERRTKWLRDLLSEWLLLV